MEVGGTNFQPGRGHQVWVPWNSWLSSMLAIAEALLHAAYIDGRHGCKHGSLRCGSSDLLRYHATLASDRC
jgi:hypothetical protein